MKRIETMLQERYLIDQDIQEVETIVEIVEDELNAIGKNIEELILVRNYLVYITDGLMDEKDIEDIEERIEEGEEIFDIKYEEMEILQMQMRELLERHYNLYIETKDYNDDYLAIVDEMAEINGLAEDIIEDMDIDFIVEEMLGVLGFIFEDEFEGENKTILSKDIDVIDEMGKDWVDAFNGYLGDCDGNCDCDCEKEDNGLTLDDIFGSDEDLSVAMDILRVLQGSDTDGAFGLTEEEIIERIYTNMEDIQVNKSFENYINTYNHSLNYSIDKGVELEHTIDTAVGFYLSMYGEDALDEWNKFLSEKQLTLEEISDQRLKNEAVSEILESLFPRDASEYHRIHLYYKVDGKDLFLEYRKDVPATRAYDEEVRKQDLVRRVELSLTVEGLDYEDLLPADRKGFLIKDALNK